MTLHPDTIRAAEAILGHTFGNPDLLVRALTHASIAEHRLRSNERLEFLGDSILGMIVCEYLYEQFPDLLEGDMTKIKSDAVSRRRCAKIAAALGLNQLLVIGKGMKTRAALPSSLAAAVLESVIGALYLDGGYEVVRDFLRPQLEPIINRAARSGHQQNFKSVLQQHTQRLGGPTPLYHLLDEQGPDHDKAFQVGVEVNGNQHEACWARSKKQAEQFAARTALVELGLLVEDESGHDVYISCNGRAADAADNDDAAFADADEPTASEALVK